MLVTNETSVPLCTGVPAAGVVVVPVPMPAVPFSITVATISMDPFDGTVGAVAKIVMTLPAGARSGTLSHAETNESAAAVVRSAREEARRRTPRRRSCDTIRDDKDNTLMYLEGQAGQRGYAMAAVLVAIALMSVVMGALLPAWRQQGQREKEAELVFRGEQYARAINLFRRKFNGASPPTIEALVDGRFLREGQDPITGEDFQILYAGQQPGQQGQQPGRGAQPGRGGQQPQGAGGIIQVISKSKETSIRVYRGAATYNSWMFVDPVGNRRGGPGGQPGQDPGRGGPGGQGPGRGPGSSQSPGGFGAPGLPGIGPPGGGTGSPSGPGRGPGSPGGPGRGPVFPGGPGRGGRGPGG